ncbi:MAG: hypothetical protein B6247_31355 [Candidatus Parabeggiatoa sp. nov. 2]|nr:MAG: hypothetical protein B6247_31355 [Beggiatoa sp. 4572_84]
MGLNLNLWISWGAAPGYINVAPLGLISWGVAPGYINVAPLGLNFFEKINITKTITFVPVILENFCTGT